jgi:heat shock protein HslJ
MKMKKIILITLVLLFLTACSGASADITGEWELISQGDVSNPTPAMPNVDTSIKFDSKGQMNGNVGCNSFGGNYKTGSDTVTFNSVASTMMYCEETNTQEQSVLGIFCSDGVKLPFQLNGDTLTITSADGLYAVKLGRK